MINQSAAGEQNGERAPRRAEYETCEALHNFIFSFFFFVGFFLFCFVLFYPLPPPSPTAWLFQLKALRLTREKPEPIRTNRWRTVFFKRPTLKFIRNLNAYETAYHPAGKLTVDLNASETLKTFFLLCQVQTSN